MFWMKDINCHDICDIKLNIYHVANTQPFEVFQMVSGKLKVIWLLVVRYFKVKN